MDGNVTLEACLMGYPIRCVATWLDQGVHVLLTGGSRTHVGAISVCQPGQAPETRVFSGHKDHFVSEPWAKRLSERFSAPACVVCGIHYDNVSKDQIAEILACTDKMLQELAK